MISWLTTLKFWILLNIGKFIFFLQKIWKFRFAQAVQDSRAALERDSTLVKGVKIKRGNEKITDFSQLSYRLRMEKSYFCAPDMVSRKWRFFYQRKLLVLGFTKCFLQFIYLLSWQRCLQVLLWNTEKWKNNSWNTNKWKTEKKTNKGKTNNL